MSTVESMLKASHQLDENKKKLKEITGTLLGALNGMPTNRPIGISQVWQMPDSLSWEVEVGGGLRKKEVFAIYFYEGGQWRFRAGPSGKYEFTTNFYANRAVAFLDYLVENLIKETPGLESAIWRHLGTLG
jgi:hypothetical protein